MGDLVAELKKEHAALIAILGEVKAKGVGSKEGQQKLDLAKKGLLGHLRKEDERLYPALQKAAQGDEKIKRMLDGFAAEMAEVSKAALAFFEKYATGGDGIEFARDFGRLSGALSARIRKEETVLYAEYQRLCSAA